MVGGEIAVLSEDSNIRCSTMRGLAVKQLNG
jgi:hypothetical protein